MELLIPYGDEKVKISLPEENVLGILQPNEVETGREEDVIKNAMAHPFDSPDLDDFIEDATSILFIVNDATRPTPTPRILDCIIERFANKKVTFIIATGIHRIPTGEEFLQILGRHYERYRDSVLVHDYQDAGSLHYFGKTIFGTEVWFNKAILDHDLIIPITSVEPHYFAGYTGGRKSFNPGIAGEETIRSNHRLALLREAQTLKLEGNPVHEDMVESARMVNKPIFAIMTVLDREHRVYAATCGNVFSSLPPAVKKAEEVFCAPIKEKADIVITVATHPSDIDLYQSQKAMDNGKLALKEGGVMILVSKCRKGTGSRDFIDLMASTKSPQETLERLCEGYKIGYHKAAKMAEIASSSRILCVSDIEVGVIKSIFMEPVRVLQDAIDRALEVKGKDAKIIVLLDGSLVVPKPMAA